MATQVLSILKAKQGEIEALGHTSDKNAASFLPLFDICPITNKMRERKVYQKAPAPTELYLTNVANDIASVWKGRTALFDPYRWLANAVTESGQHVIPFMQNKLQSLGVHVHATVGYDRWDSPDYQFAMKALGLGSNSYFCLRLDSNAIEDAAEPKYFTDQVKDVIETLGLNPALCLALIDFADVTVTSLETMVDHSKRVIDLLTPMGFTAISVAGCSMPSLITDAVGEEDSSGTVLRKESLVFQALRMEYPQLTVMHGDYGVRAPNSAEELIAPDTNFKIRYTNGNAYFVARGHSQRKGNKGAQTQNLASEVINSGHFMGPTFSWGDERIVACRDGQFSGNHGQWVGIDTNHHIAWVVAEVREFELQLASTNSPTTTG